MNVNPPDPSSIPAAAGGLASTPTRLRAVMDIDATDGLDAEEINRLRGLLTPAEGATLRDILLEIKCCDPAVGSGAFPVGLLHELVNLRRVVETAANGYVDPVRKHGNAWTHTTKAHIVENCLYGVDIQQQAIEICRLRLWLSLVVDYDIGVDPWIADRASFHHAIKELSTLPNLEMNFKRGDSLLDQISGIPVRIQPDVVTSHEKEFKAIQKLGADLHHAQKADKKRRLRVEILRLRLDVTERALTAELEQLLNQESGMFTLFEEIGSPAEKRRRVAEEKERVQEALNKVTTDRKDLEKLASRPFDGSFYPKLRRLEGADFNSPLNFVWRLDFPNIFATPSGVRNPQSAIRNGFDIILGNPPFVTARNPVKRELYRERWKRVCSGTYLLVCPFFDLSFGLLKPDGQLGFIVSNAFAKREFGKPLVEDFFPTVDLQKVIDCSGLMFPGHGTPTCIVFGRNRKPDPQSPIRVAAILPGGGDLRTPPEESPLWHTLAERHDQPGYSDYRVVISDWNRGGFLKWPLNLEAQADSLRWRMEGSGATAFGDLIAGTIGRVCFTGADELFFVVEDMLRRMSLRRNVIARFAPGDMVRNWSHDETHCVSPYNSEGELVDETEAEEMIAHLHPWKRFLCNRLSYEQTQDQRGLAWWEYAIIFPERIRGDLALSIVEIATHNHVEVIHKPFIANRDNPVINLPQGSSQSEHHLLAALLNSSSALFWLKQVCFSKRESAEGVTDTYFEFAGGKVQQLPVPEMITQSLQGESNPLAERVTDLSRQCWERGQQLPSLAMKKLVEKPGEGYHEWNASLPGHVTPHDAIGRPYETAADLRAAFQGTTEIRETLRAEMIALQEEMDWLVYEAYGLIADFGVRVAQCPQPLRREQRPFCLWAQAEGDFDNAVSLIPTDWPEERRAVWRIRLMLIRDNEHIRRIEQPVYKRRWDEQWKVGGRWQCGQAAYDAEFLNAFAWWLFEKAEWWLETQKNGGPVTLDEWTTALWSDSRVQAAWEVASEVSHRLEQWKMGVGVDANQPEPPTGGLASTPAFARYFRSLIKDQTVPDNIPWAVPWDQIKDKVPASVKHIRGKLNVPRERFRVTASGEYVWAGKDHP